MNAVDHKDYLMPAINYANRQIDNFSQRKRVTFTELTLIVEALYSMSGTNGTLVLLYALFSRSKTLVLDEAGYFTLHDAADTWVDHMIPDFLRDLPFYLENRVKHTEIEQFVPMFALGLDATKVVLKNNIWVRSRERSDKHIPVLLSAAVEEAARVNNRHASVLMPIVHMGKDEPVCSLLQIPAATFDQVRNEATAAAKFYGTKGFALRIKLDANKTPRVFSEAAHPKLVRNNVQSIVGPFWQDYMAYARAVSSQNAKMPKYVVEAVTHTLINMQKKSNDLAARLY